MELNTQTHTRPYNGHTVVVSSSQGGAGKSTISMLLAATVVKHADELFQKTSCSTKVVVVDLDILNGELGHMVGRHTPTAFELFAEPEWDVETIRKNLVFDNNTGVYLLLSPNGASDVPLSLEFYESVLGTLRSMFDFIIIDTPVRGVLKDDDPVRAAYQTADDIIFVFNGNTSPSKLVSWYENVNKGRDVPPSIINVVNRANIVPSGLQKEVLSVDNGIPVFLINRPDVFATAKISGDIGCVLYNSDMDEEYIQLASHVIDGALR